MQTILEICVVLQEKLVEKSWLSLALLALKQLFYGQFAIKICFVMFRLRMNMEYKVSYLALLLIIT